MRIFLEARPSPSRLAVWLTPVIAALATMAVGFVVFGALGKDPFAALRAFFVSPIATRYGVAELLLKATPLMLIATGLAIGYRANVWNIGAEGQLTLGAIPRATTSRSRRCSMRARRCRSSSPRRDSMRRSCSRS
jgi:simple sugar transport system permease protein